MHVVIESKNGMPFVQSLCLSLRRQDEYGEICGQLTRINKTLEEETHQYEQSADSTNENTEQIEC